MKYVTSLTSSCKNNCSRELFMHLVDYTQVVFFSHAITFQKSSEMCALVILVVYAIATIIFRTYEKKKKANRTIFADAVAGGRATMLLMKLQMVAAWFH